MVKLYCSGSPACSLLTPPLCLSFGWYLRSLSCRPSLVRTEIWCYNYGEVSCGRRAWPGTWLYFTFKCLTTLTLTRPIQWSHSLLCSTSRTHSLTFNVLLVLMTSTDLYVLSWYWDIHKTQDKHFLLWWLSAQSGHISHVEIWMSWGVRPGVRK